MTGSGCIFEHLGHIPEAAYSRPAEFSSPLEQAVYDNDVQQLCHLLQDGHDVSVRLKIGEMSCIEYAAMKGYTEVLKFLLDHSINSCTLQKYFSLPDVVERAYMISRNKKAFFNQEALAEANRYEAAVFTAVMYNQAECLCVLLDHLGALHPRPHIFVIHENMQETLSAEELAKVKGHTECYSILMRHHPSTSVVPGS